MEKGGENVNLLSRICVSARNLFLPATIEEV